MLLAIVLGRLIRVYSHVFRPSIKKVENIRMVKRFLLYLLFCLPLRLLSTSQFHVDAVGSFAEPIFQMRDRALGLRTVDDMRSVKGFRGFGNRFEGVKDAILRGLVRTELASTNFSDQAAMENGLRSWRKRKKFATSDSQFDPLTGLPEIPDTLIAKIHRKASLCCPFLTQPLDEYRAALRSIGATIFTICLTTPISFTRE